MDSPLWLGENAAQNTDYCASDHYHLFDRKDNRIHGTKIWMNLLLEPRPRRTYMRPQPPNISLLVYPWAWHALHCLWATLKTIETTKWSWASGCLELLRHSVSASFLLFRQRKAGADLAFKVNRTFYFYGFTYFILKRISMQSTRFACVAFSNKLVFLLAILPLCALQHPAVFFYHITLQSLLAAFCLRNLSSGTSNLLSKHFSVLSKQD